MVKKLISFDDEGAGLGLPDVVEQKLGGHFDGLQPGGKNLFDPIESVVEGQAFLSSGTTQYNSRVKRTVRFPIQPGQPVSISGMGTMLTQNAFRFMHFWDADNKLIKHVDYPHGNAWNGNREVLTEEMTEIAPAGAASVSFNLVSIEGATIPERLQIEIAPAPTPYAPYWGLSYGVHKAALTGLIREASTKNRYNGRVWPKMRLLPSLLQPTSNENDTCTDFIPVENGKTYTISGLDPSIASPTIRNVVGFSTNRTRRDSHVAALGSWSGSTYTVTIDNPAIKYIVISLTGSAYGTLAQAKALELQVEEGPVATTYHPPVMLVGGYELLDANDKTLRRAKKYTDEAVAPVGGVTVDLSPMGEDGDQRETAEVTRYFGPYGATYEVNGDPEVDAAGNTLTARVENVPPGQRSLWATLSARGADNKSTLPKAKVTPFSVPSGQLIYEGPTANFLKTGAKDDYVHPHIAYSDTPVAGYRYWMVASVFPGYSNGGALWEDEDLFVSNDARNWLRVKSPYETEVRPEHAPGLSLPEHDLVATTGRRYGFLPCPPVGMTLEMSMPATQYGPELDREMITITSDGSFPWKHDPAVLLDGGYVYVYHSFHLPYPDRTGGKNRFIVLTRTSDGVNWEGVRNDGSTWPVTPENTKQMFTKDAEGRYNYFFYPGGNYSNPEVIKFGDGDYEFFYGENFGQRYHGTSPWSFDFDNPSSMHTLRSANHPGLLHAGGELFLLGVDKLYRSTDRGSTWTALPFHPAWKGSVRGDTYKKAMCLGEGGKVIVIEVPRLPMSAGVKQASGQHLTPGRRYKVVIQEFDSLDTFLSGAENGLSDGYVDIHIDQVNLVEGTRQFHFYPWLGNTSTSPEMVRPHQRLKVADLTVNKGDTFHVYVTMMSRAGGSISMNTLTVE